MNSTAEPIKSITHVGLVSATKILLSPSSNEGVPKAQEHNHSYQNLRDHQLLTLQLALL